MVHDCWCILTLCLTDMQDSAHCQSNSLGLSKATKQSLDRTEWQQTDRHGVVTRHDISCKPKADVFALALPFATTSGHLRDIHTVSVPSMQACPVLQQRTVTAATISKRQHQVLPSAVWLEPAPPSTAHEAGPLLQGSLTGC